AAAGKSPSQTARRGCAGPTLWRVSRSGTGTSHRRHRGVFCERLDRSGRICQGPGTDRPLPAESTRSARPPQGQPSRRGRQPGKGSPPAARGGQDPGRQKGQRDHATDQPDGPGASAGKITGAAKESSMNPTLPSWFKQRQGKAEPKGADTFQLTAPNLRPAFISIRRGDNNLWAASLRLTEDGPPVAATEPEFPRPEEAWEAAFELYRVRVVV